MAATAGCNVVEPWAAVVIGIIAGTAYCSLSFVISRVGVDDATDVIGGIFNHNKIFRNIVC